MLVVSTGVSSLGGSVREHAERMPVGFRTIVPAWKPRVGLLAELHPHRPQPHTQPLLQPLHPRSVTSTFDITVNASTRE
jgi:hypothetical protein